MGDGSYRDKFYLSKNPSDDIRRDIDIENNINVNVL